MEQPNYIAIFDSLKSKQRVKIAISACMGTGDRENAKPTEYIVGRRGKGRHGETIAMMPADGSKPSPGSKLTLHKRKFYNSDELFVTGALGDMAVTLVSVELL